MNYLTPAAVDRLHIKNQESLCPVSPMRQCTHCKLRRSVAQYWNRARKPVFKLCKVCRGVR